MYTSLCVLLLLAASVTAIDLRMCMRNCRQNDHYCIHTGAPGETRHFCMQKRNECDVGCVQNCKKACGEKFSTDKCVGECQYRGMMMVEMGMQFIGTECMEECMFMATQCNTRCDDAFNRKGLRRPLMEYIYPEQLQEDWTVETGLMDSPYQSLPSQFERRRRQGSPKSDGGRRL